VQQIATATAEQARGSEQIMKSAERMKAITKHVERSSQEQTRGSKQITKAIESISEMVSHLNAAQREQTRGGEQILASVEQMRDIIRRQEGRLVESHRVVGELSQRWRSLRARSTPPAQAAD
jgi:methyl-accepting chemotaxis protein